MSPSLLNAVFVTALTFAALDNARAAVRYVNGTGSTPTAPFTSWATAATNIQDAVDAATAGDDILVTNGIYATGGRAVFAPMTNRVVVDKVSIRLVGLHVIPGVARFQCLIRPLGPLRSRKISRPGRIPNYQIALTSARLIKHDQNLVNSESVASIKMYH